MALNWYRSFTSYRDARNTRYRPQLLPCAGCSCRKNLQLSIKGEVITSAEIQGCAGPQHKAADSHSEPSRSGNLSHVRLCEASAIINMPRSSTCLSNTAQSALSTSMSAAMSLSLSSSRDCDEAADPRRAPAVAPRRSVLEAKIRAVPPRMHSKTKRCAKSISFGILWFSSSQTTGHGQPHPLPWPPRYLHDMQPYASLQQHPSGPHHSQGIHECSRTASVRRSCSGGSASPHRGLHQHSLASHLLRRSVSRRSRCHGTPTSLSRVPGSPFSPGGLLLRPRARTTPSAVPK